MEGEPSGSKYSFHVRREFAGTGGCSSFLMPFSEVAGSGEYIQRPEDVDISLSDNRLTIKREFLTEDEGERGNVYYQERRYGKFERSFALLTGIDTD